ncbi:uncharacterized protein RJT20DRAFT_57652 [Scheffersomyces xylosifermentans]|uniref:uncharacterized protein n=1 Tax=Scheffersomyces xylosifermentans TaxID=1304137 RepID=UPI00315D64D1
MSGKFVRASKYRHVFGQAAKRELCYENLKITKNAWDSNIIQSNGQFLAVNWDASGGGAFAVIPVNEVGKAPDTVPLFRGHKGPVLDTAFNPFNKRQIVSCSDDGKILLWEIPEDYSFHKYVDEEENIKDVTEPIKVLSGHTRKVGLVEFHPAAENVLASSSLDYSVKIWNLETGKAEITLQHKDLVTSFAFNYNGSLLATTSRDKKLRIWDIRSGKIVSEGAGHTGAKPSRVVWLGNTDRILTTGFSRLSDRQVGVWDINNIEKGPIDGFLVIDASSGVLIPIYDESTNMLFLAGKGDGNIRYYEYENDYLHELSQYASTDPQRGFAVAPKSAVNVKENEVLKSFKTVNDHAIEPISFIVPRRSELFQEDIYPDCPSDKPALTAQEWFGGKDANGPLLMSMEALYEGSEPTIRESPSVTVVSAAKEEAEKKEEEEKVKLEEKKKEEAAKPKETFVKESTPATKNVDELLKSSDDVNNLLNKVADQSDDEEEAPPASDDKDEWEQVEKADAESLSKSKEIVEETKEPVVEKVKEEPKTEPVSLPKAETKAVEIEPKEVAKIETKSEPEVPETKQEDKSATNSEVSSIKSDYGSAKAASPIPTPSTPRSTASAGAPTLKGTVEKLHGIVENLESHILKLTQASLEKDERLSALEKKIDELLKK